MQTRVGIDQKGSSLLELIIAAFIFTLIVLGLNSCLYTVIKSNVNSKDVSSATAAGNALLEQIHTLDYSSILSGTDVVKGRFGRTWTVTDAGPKKTVQVTVVWPQPSPKHSMSLTTVIAHP